MRSRAIRHFGAMLALAWLSPTAAPARPLDAAELAVAGAWKLVRSEQTLKAGGVRANPAYGDRALGYVIYHRSHAFCLFLTRAEDDAARPPQPGDGINAYCGTWSIDPVAGTMYHHTEMDVLPRRRALLRSPHYEIRDGLLYLHPPIEDPAVASYVLIFRKLDE